MHTNSWSGLNGIVLLMHMLILALYLIAAVFILVSVALISGKLLQAETGDMAVITVLGLTVLSGCGARAKDPGEPPVEVVNGENTVAENSHSGNTDTENNSVQAESNNGMDGTEEGDLYEGEILSDAISVRSGRDGADEWNVDMYNNDAALTMLDYLSGSALLFPTYTYDEEGGFVAQSVRGNYTRDDE